MNDPGSDKAPGAVNQQERLESYLAGFVDGEGSFHVAVQRNPSTRSRWQIVPEFRISQDVSRVEVLELAKRCLGCGVIRENHRGTNDRTLVLVIRRRGDLLTRIIPFFERNPLLSCKQREFATFARIVRAMEEGEHRTKEGFERLVAIAIRMNGGGRYRRIHRNSTPESSETICRASRESDEDMVRSAWRHAEPGRNVLARDRTISGNNNVGPYPMQP